MKELPDSEKKFVPTLNFKLVLTKLKRKERKLTPQYSLVRKVIEIFP